MMTAPRPRRSSSARRTGNGPSRPAHRSGPGLLRRIVRDYLARTVRWPQGGNVVTVRSAPAGGSGKAIPTYRDGVRAFDRALITAFLERSGTQADAARRLGFTAANLTIKMGPLGLRGRAKGHARSLSDVPSEDFQPFKEEFRGR